MSAPPLTPSQKLLVLTSTYPRWKDDPEPGFVHELCRRLTADFDVRVLCPHAPGAPSHETMDGIEIVRYRYAPESLETLVNNGGIVGNLKRARWKGLLVPFFLLGQLWATWREIRRWQPDVVHAHWLIPQGLIIALLKIADRRTPPFLVTSHGADLFALRSQPLLALKHFVARQAAAVTVVSHAMKEELKRMGVETSIGVASMGVDLRTRFTPPATVATRSLTEILFVGRMVEKKGLRYLIAAMPEVLSRHPDAHLTIAGFGPEMQERLAQVRSLSIEDKVTFLGALPQNELPGLYRRAGLFVAPFVQATNGDQDGLGLVLVEALGCGCPVLVSDIPASQDVANGIPGIKRIPGIRNGSLGKAIAECLDTIEEHWHAVEGANGILKDRFDWKSVAKKYSLTLKGIANRNSE